MSEKCGEKTEVYSRVVGYFRPVTQWNKGKQSEFKDRKTFVHKHQSELEAKKIIKETAEKMNLKLSDEEIYGLIQILRTLPKIGITAEDAAKALSMGLNAGQYSINDK